MLDAVSYWKDFLLAVAVTQACFSWAGSNANINF